MSQLEYPIWNNKKFRSLAFSSKTGRNLKSRDIKSHYRKHLKHMVHGATLKPGDYIQTCRDNFNHKIVSIMPDYWKFDNNFKVFTRDFAIKDEDDHLHWWANCCGAPLTVEEIEAYWKTAKPEDFEHFKRWDEEYYNKFMKHVEALQNRLANSHPITNQFGRILMELKFNDD